MRNTLPLSSFPLQLLLYVQKYYSIILSVFALVLVLFKTYNLPYSTSMAIQQGIILIIFIIFWRIRMQWGNSANQTESSNKMMGYLALTLIGLIFAIYYIFIQYFVLLIEVILFAILLVVNSLQLIVGLFACWQFQTYQKQQ